MLVPTCESRPSIPCLDAGSGVMNFWVPFKVGDVVLTHAFCSLQRAEPVT